MSSIAIIIPAYNAMATLNETVASVVDQTWPDWEAVIVNDGSTDETGRLAEEWAQRDQRIRVIHQENGNQAAARNTGIRNSSPPWILCLDADDLLEPDALQAAAMVIGQKEAADNACGRCLLLSYRMFHDAGAVFREQTADASRHDSLTTYVRHLPFWPPCSHLFERRILERTAPFDPSIQGGEDGDMWLRFLRVGVRFEAVRDAWVRYRVLSGSMSTRSVRMMESHAIAFRRTMTDDDRCTTFDLGERLSPLEVEGRIIPGIWHLYLRRALSQANHEGALALWQWGRENLTEDYWRKPEQRTHTTLYNPEHVAGMQSACWIAEIGRAHV